MPVAARRDEIANATLAETDSNRQSGGILVALCQRPQTSYWSSQSANAFSGGAKTAFAFIRWMAVSISEHMPIDLIWIRERRVVRWPRSELYRFMG
jgi:hypothetical protein